QTMADPGGYTENTGGELLAHGAAAGVVGFSSPGPCSSPGWSKPDHGNYNTVGYYFVENLIQNHYTVGRSLYEAKIRYTNKFWNNNYQPFHWSFHLFGDPSMILEGYDDSAKDTNRTIHIGSVYAYGTDNADNGDMYVAVSTRSDTEDGEIKVYKSTDDGEHWNLWATIGHGEPILAVDVIVGQCEGEEWSSDYVHVFFTDTAGHVIDARIDMTTTVQSRVTIASEGDSANLPLISAARDPMPMPSAFNLYVTWEVDSGTSHQVKGALSTVNGNTWTNPFSYDGYQQPHTDAGPWNRVYLVAVADAFPNDVHVKRSTDRGASWDGWTNLTSGDDASYHGAPVVAASTDAAIPTVWVAYNYYETVTYGGSDLRFAYSKDSGGSWTKNRILSAEQGFDELMPDMVGYRASASRWMNVAYHHSQSTRTNVV
ncbi:MAG: exo-alpha-sialidase, partial [Anaerolineae bacterium]|nr:exo-alpha-sialidase [Anaerolineae bacterium]